MEFVLILLTSYFGFHILSLFIVYIVAAQASRDRKKEMSQQLEIRVAELEAQLALANSSSSTPSLLPSLVPSFEPTPSTSALEEENQTLRLQLQLEQLQSAQLKSRLGSLEDKFARLEAFLSSTPSTTTTPNEVNLVSQSTMDNSRLIASEASQQRKLSLLSTTTRSHPLSSLSHLRTMLPPTSQILISHGAIGQRRLNRRPLAGSRHNTRMISSRASTSSRTSKIRFQLFVRRP